MEIFTVSTVLIDTAQKKPLKNMKHENAMIMITVL